MSPTEKSNSQDEHHPLTKTSLVREHRRSGNHRDCSLFHPGRSGESSEPILAYRVGVLYLAFAAALILVASRFRNDREWLMIPITMDLAEFANSLFQVILVVTHANIPADPMAVVPLVVTGV